MSLPVRAAGTLQAITLLLPVTMTVMGVVVLLPVLPALTAHFAAVPHVALWVPVLLTIPAVMVVLFAPVAGLLADLLGRRRLLLGAMVLYAAFGTAPFYMKDFAAIFATRIGVGVCEAAVLVVTTTLIGDYFTGAVRDRWLAWQTGLAAVSATLLIVAGGMLGGVFGWRGPFLIYGLALPLALLVALFTWEPAPDQARMVVDGSSWVGFPLRRMAGICGITVFASFLFYLVQVEFTFALGPFGVTDPAVVGQMLALVSLGIILGSASFRFVARVHVAVQLCGELLLAGFGLLGMAWAPSAGFLAASGFISQVGAGLFLPTLLTWAVRGLSFEHRGRGTGLWQGTFVLGQFLVSIGMPALNATTGGLAASFAAIGVATLLAAGVAGLATLRATAPRETLA